ncbi:hypothetical protein A4G18_02220 [Pasteurellaceae bacterium Pebbles2]|nr:hypothetical protein [Pasteurellaceae bacterium Pebbles2]
MKIKKISWAVMLSLGSIANIAHINQASAVEKNDVFATTELDAIVVEGVADNPFKTVQQSTLKRGSSTLGNALSKQMGINANHFGSGASTPVIRGQESYRNHIAQNGNEVTDLSNLSPDHAIMVEPILAKEIKVLQGADTLLYGSGVTGAVVNIIDDKIPTEKPFSTVEGSFDTRYNTNNHEQIHSVSTNFSLSDNVVLHLEGLNRRAKNYKSAGYTETELIENPCNNLDTPECDAQFEAGDYQFKIPKYTHYRHINNSDAKSTQGSVGLSWVGERGYLGIAYTQRNDFYGLTGHEHKAHFCHIHTHNKNDLYSEGINLHCEHTSKNIRNGDPHLHQHNDNGGPNAPAKLDLQLRRVDVRGALNQPINSIEQLRFSASQSQYHHSEMEGSYVMSSFKNHGKFLRVEADHKAIGGFSGNVALQYGENLIDSSGFEGILDKNRTKKFALAALERYQWNDFTLSAAGRIEHQRIHLLYDKLLHIKDPEDPLKSNQYQKTAYSFSSALDWQMNNSTKWSLIFSHQERVPSAQELYAKGTHVATNSYEFGDDQYDRMIHSAFTPKKYTNSYAGDVSIYKKYGINQRLGKEKSNNLELGVHIQQDKIRAYFGSYYKYFNNYIYARTIDRDGNYRLLRYAQQPAHFYGVEGDISYQFTPIYRIGIFGDYVRGKLDDGNAPRMPAARLGARINADFTENLSGELEFIHTFSQRKTALNERPVSGFNLLNLGFSYQNSLTHNIDYRLNLNANNLLNSKPYASTSYLSHIPLMGRNVAVGASLLF